MVQRNLNQFIKSKFALSPEIEGKMMMKKKNYIYKENLTRPMIDNACCFALQNQQSKLTEVTHRERRKKTDANKKKRIKLTLN